MEALRLYLAENVAGTAGLEFARGARWLSLLTHRCPHHRQAPGTESG